MLYEEIRGTKNPENTTTVNKSIIIFLKVLILSGFDNVNCLIM